MWGRAASASRDKTPRGVERFAARRRLRRRRASLLLLVVTLVTLLGGLYLVNQSFLRIATLSVFGTDKPIEQIAHSYLQGKYFGLVPHDSMLFYPSQSIRAAILSAYPDIAAVSFSRTGLTGLSIRVTNRVPIAAWCGASPVASSSPETISKPCFFFDTGGMLFATTTSEAPVNSFRVYVPLAAGVEPAVRVIMPIASQLPAVFDFARQVSVFGVSVDSVVVRDLEVDILLTNGTRITYVRGTEQRAFAALSSARVQLDLAHARQEYVDLRFEGKVYSKPRDDLHSFGNRFE